MHSYTHICICIYMCMCVYTYKHSFIFRYKINTSYKSQTVQLQPPGDYNKDNISNKRVVRKG